MGAQRPARRPVKSHSWSRVTCVHVYQLEVASWSRVTCEQVASWKQLRSHT